jgi:hypothetical protein
MLMGYLWEPGDVVTIRATKKSTSPAEPTVQSGRNSEDLLTVHRVQAAVAPVISNILEHGGSDQ